MDNVSDVTEVATVRRARQPPVRTAGHRRSLARALIAPQLEALRSRPTDLDELARRLGVREVISAEMNAHGELQQHADGFTILFAADQGPARRRFTLAHELAHVLVKRSAQHALRGLRLERFCDDIAAELLMPAAAFARDAGARPDAARVKRLATLYRTSLAATALRCAELTRTAAFEAEDGAVLWRHGVAAAAVNTLVRAFGPDALARRAFATTFDIVGEEADRRVEILGLGRGRSLWLLVPRTVAERVIQPALIPTGVALR